MSITGVFPDTVEPIEMGVEERRMMFDIEVDDRGAFPQDGEKRIVSIVAHDNLYDSQI